MPCTDGGSPYPRMTEDEKDATPLACAALSWLEYKGYIREFLNDASWIECGLTQSRAETWWHDHKERDRKRREAEADATERRRLQKEAYSKLTPEERKALGLRAG